MGNRVSLLGFLSLILCMVLAILQTPPIFADTQGYELTKKGFVCEAEDCTLSGTYAVKTDVTASGGKYVSSTSKAWSTSVSADETGELELYLESESVARYALWVRCKIGNSDGSRSVFWGWNNSNYTAVWFSACSEWKWQKIGFVTMVTGANKIKISKRAPGAMFDKIMLCEVRYTPSGEGVLPDDPSDYAVTNPYALPPVMPPENTHPRVLVNETRKQAIKQTVALLDSFLPKDAEFYEAEQQIHVDGFSHIGQDSEAHNGEYLMGYSDCLTMQEDAEGELTFAYTAKKAGSHAVWIRCKVPSVNADTLFYRVEGEAWNTAQFAVSSQYGWQKVGIVNLAEGENAIQFHHREASLRIDRILVTSDTELSQFSETVQDSRYPSIEPICRAYQQMMAYKNSQEKALYALPTNWDVRNYEATDLSVIQAKAFFWLIKDDAQSAKSAYEMLKNFMTTAHFLRDIHSIRNIGDTVFTGALVYDWCYSQFTAAEREELRTSLLDLQAMMETGYPPSTKNSISGHMGENEVLRDSLSLGIAIYDEESCLYHMAAGGIFQNMVDWYKYMYQGGFHSQGTAYGIHTRYMPELMATALFDAIGYRPVFGDNQKNIAYEMLYATRPDGQMFRDGDIYYGAWQDETPLFLAAHIYGDTNINAGFFNMNRKYGNHVPYLYYMALGDITLPVGDISSLPLTRFYDSPAGAMMARTGWKDGKSSNDAMAFFKIGTDFFGGHQHMDSGQFQIYYKGGLAIASGIYSSYGDSHHTNYYTRTIAHNSMLVYDPDEQFSGITANDGGQKALNKYIDSLDTMLNNDYAKCGEILAHGFGPNPDKPYYSYLKGKLTNAYSSKMEDFERSFVFLNFEDEEYPAAVIVLDRVETSSPEWKKTWLLHSVEEPEVDEITTVIKRTEYDYNGKLVNTTLQPKSENLTINVVGGTGQEFMVDGVNYATGFTKTEVEEGAGYRIEISPVQASKTDYFLNVMQVMDNKDSLNGQEVAEFEDDSFLGAYVGNSLTLFSKGETVSNSFDLNLDGETKTVIFGVSNGVWSIRDENGSVTYISASAEDGAIMFVPDESGTYTFTPEEVWMQEITDTFVTDSFGCYDESGTKIRQLSDVAGSAVELRASIRRLGMERDRATLIAAIYQDGILYDLDMEAGVYSSVGDSYSYKLMMDVPADVTSCAVKMFLWDDAQGLCPITPCAKLQPTNLNAFGDW